MNPTTSILADEDHNGRQITDALLAIVPVQVAQDTSAFTMVTSTGLIADAANVLHYGKVAGLTILAVLNGFVADLVAHGEVTNNSWSWSPGDKIFLNGTSLSTTPPSTGFCQMVAVARNANVIIMKLEIPILL